MRPLVILNPNSQGGKTGARADELCRVIERYLGAIDVAQTERPRHGVTVAEEAADAGREVVIAVGGDGTIHEVVNGLMRAKDRGVAVPRLGIVGQGTGGDLRRTLALEHRLDRYCQVIAAGKTRSVDVGRLHYRDHDDAAATAYFVNILGIGLGGLVDRYITRSARRFGGTVAYFTSTLKALAQSEIGVVRCRARIGSEEREYRLSTRTLAICNGRYFGGGMEVAPMATLDDGLFHVVSLGDAPKLEFFLSSLSIYRGKHVELPKVEIFACDAIDIDLDNPRIREVFPLDVDGEPLGLLPLRVELVPRALSIFSP
ncbi:MAG: diacylglycerol kinase family lipid kinase [Deltaproteobacteria bacterium]|nr:diacylglycerol kinase family lipid kinase [Deltaproteobacteria bacterium]